MKINNISLINLANNNTAPKIVRNKEKHIQQQPNLMNGLNALSTMNQSLVSFKSNYIPSKHGVYGLDKAQQRADIVLEQSQLLKAQTQEIIPMIQQQSKDGLEQINSVYTRAKELVNKYLKTSEEDRVILSDNEDGSQTKILAIFDDAGKISETVKYDPRTFDVLAYQKFSDKHDGTSTKLIATHRGDVGLSIRNLFLDYNEDDIGNVSASKLYSYNNGRFIRYYENYKRTNLGAVSSDLYANQGIEFYKDYRKVPLSKFRGEDITSSMYCEYTANTPSRIDVDYLSDDMGIQSKSTYFFDDNAKLSLYKENHFKSKNRTSKIQESIEELIRYTNGKMDEYENAYYIDNRGIMSDHSLFIA